MTNKKNNENGIYGLSHIIMSIIMGFVLIGGSLSYCAIFFFNTSVELIPPLFLMYHLFVFICGILALHYVHWLIKEGEEKY